MVISGQLYLHNSIFCNSVSSIIGQYKIFSLKQMAGEQLYCIISFDLAGF